MQITINGAVEDIEADTLAAVLAALDLEDAVVATALNGTFVPARLRPAQPVVAGDQIEILAPMQGG